MNSLVSPIRTTARRWVESGIKMLSPNLGNSRQLKYNALFRVSPKAAPMRPGLNGEGIGGFSKLPSMRKLNNRIRFRKRHSWSKLQRPVKVG